MTIEFHIIIVTAVQMFVQEPQKVVINNCQMSVGSQTMARPKGTENGQTTSSCLLSSSTIPPFPMFITEDITLRRLMFKLSSKYWL